MGFTGVSFQPIRPAYLPFSLERVGSVALSLDFLATCAASVGIGTAYHFLRSGTFGDLSNHLGVGFAVGAAVCLTLQLQGMYSLAELLRPARQLKTLTRNWIAVFVFYAAVAFALKIGDVFSRGSVLLFVIFGWVVLAVIRRIWKSVLQSALNTGSLRRKPIALLIAEGYQISKRFKATLSHCGLEIAATLSIPTEGADGLNKNVYKILTSLRGSQAEEVMIVGDLKNSSAVIQYL